MEKYISQNWWKGHFNKFVKLLFRCPRCGQWYDTTDYCEDCNENE